jgi:hypothetical protein
MSLDLPVQARGIVLVVIVNGSLLAKNVVWRAGSGISNPNSPL